MKTYSGIQLHVHFGENEELFLQTLANLRVLATVPGMREGLALAVMRAILPRELQSSKPKPPIVVTECKAYRANDGTIWCDECVVNNVADKQAEFICAKERNNGN